MQNISIQSGGARVTLLSDGTSYWDGGGTFGLVPRTKWAKVLPPDDNNLVPQELRCVLIEVDGKRILVDCGVGNKPNDLIASQYLVKQPNGNLMDDLARHGLSANDIDIVIFTHLHGDHSGWATVQDSGGVEEQGGRGAEERGSEGESTSAPPHLRTSPSVVPTFPNARYHVQRSEYEDATHTNERTRNTYFAENFVPLHDHGVLTLLDGNTQITPGVRVVHTPGHTAGHQSVIIHPVTLVPTPPLILLGDMAPYMIHFERLPWVTAYDVMPLVTIESKRIWQQWAVEHSATLVSCHDTRTPIGQLARNDKGLFSVVAQ